MFCYFSIVSLCFDAAGRNTRSCPDIVRLSGYTKCNAVLNVAIKFQSQLFALRP
jgi:hypothetical protein